jgi:hypothetical protein
MVMNPRVIAFAVLVLVFALSLILIAVRAYRRAQKSSQTDWDQLLGRLAEVDRSSIAEVALDVVDESGEQRRDVSTPVLEPEEIWKRIGGMDGLEVLERNCSVLIDLAFYVQRRYPEAIVVAEQLRLNAREIEWHLGRLRSARETGKLESAFSMYAPRAVAVYYLMTRKLLALYAKEGLDQLSDLERAI